MRDLFGIFVALTLLGCVDPRVVDVFLSALERAAVIVYSTKWVRVPFMIVVALALSSARVGSAVGAECSADEKVAARLERTINEALSLPPELLYISGPTSDVFYEWDPLELRDVNAVYGREMDVLPQERLIPERSTALHSAFDAYKFVLKIMQVAPNTLNRDALKKRRNIEKKLYSDAQRAISTAEYEFFIKARNDLEDVQKELEGVPATRMTNAQRTKLAQARRKVSVDAEGALYSSLEQQLSQIDAADLSKVRPQELAKLQSPSASALSHFPSLGVVVTAGNWKRVTVSFEKLSAEACLAGWPSMGTGYSAWHQTSAPAAGSGLNVDISSIEGRSLEFELTSVDVLRPWLNHDVLQSHAWHLPSDLSRYAVSNGNEVRTLKSTLESGRAPEATTTTAILPYVPSKIVFARHFRLSGVADAERTWLAATFRSGASAKFGPFDIAGRLITTSRVSNLGPSPYVFGNLVGEVLSFPSPQRIGTVVMQVPRAPNPDHELWTSKSDQ